MQELQFGGPYKHKKRPLKKSVADAVEAEQEIAGQPIDAIRDDESVYSQCMAELNSLQEQQAHLKTKEQKIKDILKTVENGDAKAVGSGRGEKAGL